MSRRVAIIGAGPTGIEAGTAFAREGFDVTVYERGAPGAHVARWAHVRFFSPWRLNRSSWGAKVLEEAGRELADEESFPTGAEYLQTYLRPLIETGPLAGRVKNLTSVVAVTRRDAWKSDLIGKRDAAGPFLLAVSTPDGDDLAEADIVLDASGVYGQPNRLGPGGLAVPGESSAENLIENWIPDILDRDRQHYADRHVLVVGQGHSASTTLHLLSKLRASATDTRVTWILHRDTPFPELEDDPLPERLQLSRFGNRAALGQVDGIEPIVGGRIHRIESHSDGASVTVAVGEEEKVVDVDRIVSNVGYRPDLSMTRELQIHHCWASEGPMKLAASLLAQSGNADCLAQESAGIDLLRNPEPNFFVIGAKSYGRNSNFLLRVGFEQIAAILGSFD